MQLKIVINIRNSKNSNDLPSIKTEPIKIAEAQSPMKNTKTDDILTQKNKQKKKRKKKKKKQ